MNGPGKNYYATSDPNVVIGKKGARITMDDFKHANANGYAWKDFDAYADYVGNWAKPLPPNEQQTTQTPFYRVYGGQPNLNAMDIQLLKMKYQDDPKVSAILNRNIAPAGEVHQYASDDADIIKGLIQQEKQAALSSNPQYAKK